MPSSAALVRLLRRRFVPLIAVLAVIQSIALLALSPGVLSIDEVTYHAMTRSLAKGSLAVENGWELAASPELEWELVRQVDGRLVSQYPEGLAVVGAPLYRLLGIGGLFLLNTLAFFGTVLLCRALAREVLRKDGPALLAAIIFACATFAWEYGAAVWPHALCTLLTTAAVHQMLVAARESSPSRAVRRRLAAGLMVGVATTFRLDAVFMLPALLLIPALVPERVPSRASATAALTVLAGTLPAGAFLAVTNHVKFGTWQPFSYGPWHGAGSNTGTAQYVPLGVLALAGLVAVHALAPRLSRLRRNHVLAAVVCAALSLLVPQVRDAVVRTLDGLWMLVFDLRHRDVSWNEAALSRSPRGGMIYIDTFKLSLLQSCPYLPVIVFAMVARGNDAALRRRKLAVLLPIGIVLAVFSYCRWHGGLSVNLRYFVPLLPLVAILGADGMARLARRCAPVLRSARASDLIVLVSVATYLETVVLLHLPTAAWSTREIFYLDVPLCLTAVLSVATFLAARSRPGRLRTWAAAAAFTLGAVGLVWAGLTEITYDAVAVMRVRARGHVIAARARPFVSTGSLVIADYLDPVAGLIEDGVIVANGSRDDFADSPRLVAAMACHGRRSYAVMRRGSWEKLEARFAVTEISGAILREDRATDVVIAELTSRSSCRRSTSP